MFSGWRFCPWPCSAPSTVRADDQQIAQQIIEKLQAEKQAGSLKGFSIDLQVDEGTVWLSGRVASEQQQAEALDLARRVPRRQAGRQRPDHRRPAQQAGRQPPRQAAAPAPTSAARAAPSSQRHSGSRRRRSPLRAAAGRRASQLQSRADCPAEYGELRPDAAVIRRLAVAASRQQLAGDNAMLNSISKALVSAVNGGRTRTMQNRSASLGQPGGRQRLRELGAIGSGVDATQLPAAAAWCKPLSRWPTCRSRLLRPIRCSRCMPQMPRRWR